jgi:hypothetical protein
MKKIYPFGAALLTMGMVAVSPDARAADAPIVARAVVADSCIVTKADATAGDVGTQRPESAGLILGTALAGLAGDAFAAAGDALGSALEEASRERTFSAAASANFDFYQIQGADPAEHLDVRVEPRLKPAGSLCLILFVPAPARAEPATMSVLDSPNTDTGQLVQEWERLGFGLNPGLYVEAELQLRADGFRVRPVLIWYRTALPSAPNRELPAEIHATFSTPGAPTAETSNGETFAVARIPLPRMGPRATPYFASDLFALGSAVIPLRGKAGSPEDLRASLAADIAAEADNTAEIARLRQAVARSAGAVRQANQDALAAAQSKTPRLHAIAERARRREYALPVGSTNVTVRFALVRDANAFGMAIARALRGRTQTAGTALATALAPQTAAQAWTAEDTTYVTEMNQVAAQQRVVDAARTSGDAEALFTAEQALRLAKAEANGAAAAAGQRLPFPSL